MIIKACWLITSIFTILFPTWTALADNAKLTTQHKEKIKEKMVAIRESNMTVDEKLKAMEELRREQKESLKDMKPEERGAVSNEAKKKFEEEAVKVIYSD